MKKQNTKKTTKKKTPPLTLLETAIKTLTPNTDKWPYSGYVRYVFSGVEYDYDMDWGCKSQECDGVCRCKKIHNARITKVDIGIVASCFMSYITSTKPKPKQPTTFELYCIERIIRSSKLREDDYWELDIHKGYYGDECDGPFPNQTTITNIRNMFVAISKLSDVEKIKYCLKEEYGHLLPKLQDATKAEIIAVDPKDIEMSNDNYMRKLNKEHVDQYNDYDLPRGIVVAIGGKFKYRLIDGYHRISSANNQSLKTIDVILLN